MDSISLTVILFGNGIILIGMTVIVRNLLKVNQKLDEVIKELKKDDELT